MSDYDETWADRAYRFSQERNISPAEAAYLLDLVPSERVNEVRRELSLAEDLLEAERTKYAALVEAFEQLEASLCDGCGEECLECPHYEAIVKFHNPAALADLKRIVAMMKESAVDSIEDDIRLLEEASDD